MADLSFVIAISRVGKQVRRELQERGLLWSVSADDAALRFGGPAVSMPPGDMLIAETSIVDDVAYPIVAPAAQLVERVAAVASATISIYARFGFRINVAPQTKQRLWSRGGALALRKLKQR